MLKTNMFGRHIPVLPRMVYIHDVLSTKQNLTLMNARVVVYVYYIQLF